MKKLFLILVAVLSIGLCASAQTRTITGTVVDATTDEPLIGASVTPTGSKNGVVTDANGNFSLTIAPSVKSITVSYVGCQPFTGAPQNHMTISLMPEASALSALVVTGYGKGKAKGSLVGSVAVVGEETLSNVTTPTFVDALQGQVSGLSVMSDSGDPSSMQTRIRLRGVNSLNSDNTPLFILDGAPITESVFTTLNPNDLESIVVLKDAASVAIYGSRAANGVIVITSKRGKYAEKANVNIRAKYGWSQMTSDKTEMMNSAQYIKFRDLIGQPVSQEMRDAWEVYGIDTDWRSEIFDGTAPTYSLEAAVTGGSEAAHYYLSLNHLDQQGIIDQSSMRRETLRVSLDSRITNWFRVGVQTNLGYTKYQTNNESNAIYSGSGVYSTNPMVTARKALPMDSPYYYTIGDDGKIIWGDKAMYLHFSRMPTPEYIESNRSVWRNRVTINGNLWEEITPIPELTLRAQQSVDAYDYRVDNTGFAYPTFETPMGDVYPQSGGALPGDINTGYNQQSFSRYYSFTYTNTAEYQKKFADVHYLTVLLGQESIYSKSSGFGLSTEGQSDRRQFLLNQGTSVSMSDVSYSIAELAMNSFFASVSYNYRNKYFIDTNFRRDGSSRFAPGHRWANFWSAGAKWDAKQEKFFQGLQWLDAASLRVSYGTTGNSNFANYGYFGLIGDGKNYNGEGSLGISQAPNYSLTWEKVAGLDAGINFGMFNIFNLDVAFYNKNTKDMLIQVPYSMTTGVSAGWGNVAAMRNTGVDIDLTVTPIRSRDWMWELRANFNYNKNKITKLFDGLDELIFADSNVIYRVGETANAFYMVRYAGVDPRDGQQMWYTKDDNLTKTYNFERDAVCIDDKSQYAPLSGGFGTTVGWKGLSLRVDFSWAAKKYMLNNDLYFTQNTAFAQSFNQTTKMLEVWTTPGQVTDIPAVGQTLEFDTRWLEDASFVRLKNVTLQYQFPRSLVKRWGLEGLGAHFTGRNLLTFTGYSGYDPEPETNIIAFFYPNTRQYEIGIDVSF